MRGQLTMHIDIVMVSVNSKKSVLFVEILTLLDLSCVDIHTSEMKWKKSAKTFNLFHIYFVACLCIQCFDAVGWAAERASDL